MYRKFATSVALGSLLFFLEPGAMPQGPPGPPQNEHHGPWWAASIASTETIHASGGEIQVDFAAGPLDLTPAQILPWIQRAVRAITVYYGRFPVAHARVLILPVADRKGILQGTTWGDMHGVPGFTRIRLGQHTTVQDLNEDWTMPHEFDHMTFPSMPDDQHWIEEGLATYIEPVARVQAGELTAAQIWNDMLDGMPKGEPGPDDQGMDRTHTWGRTYWGGALFCLVADIEIRKQTGNHKGLQDALRAIVAAGGTIDHDWSITQAFDIGDKATGTSVLIEQYKRWSQAPSPVDLPKLWKDLGVARGPDGAVFDSHAPLAAIREAITRAPRSQD